MSADILRGSWHTSTNSTMTSRRCICDTSTSLASDVTMFSPSGSHTEVLLLRRKVKRRCHMALKAPPILAPFSCDDWP